MILSVATESIKRQEECRMSSNGTAKKTNETKKRKGLASSKLKAPSCKTGQRSSESKSTEEKSVLKSPRAMTKASSSRSSTRSGLKPSGSSPHGQPQDKKESSSQWSNPTPMPEEHRRILLQAISEDGTIRTKVMGRPKKAPDEKENPYGLRLSLKQRRAYDDEAKRKGFRSWQTWLKELGNKAAGIEKAKAPFKK